MGRIDELNTVHAIRRPTAQLLLLESREVSLQRCILAARIQFEVWGDFSYAKSVSWFGWIALTHMILLTFPVNAQVRFGDHTVRHSEQIDSCLDWCGIWSSSAVRLDLLVSRLVKQDSKAIADIRCPSEQRQVPNVRLLRIEQRRMPHAEC